MKWVLLAVVLLIVVGALWLLTARRSAHAASNRPHRLDDCLTTRDTLEPQAPDDPTATGAQVMDAGVTDRT